MTVLDAVRGRGGTRPLWLPIYGAALLVALFVVFVIWRSQSFVAQTNDLYRFGDIGKNIAEGHGFRFTGGELTMRRGPGYPALIALLYTLFGPHPVVVQVAQAFLAAGTCALVFEIGRRLFSVRAGLIAAALTALHPMVMRYVPDIQVEALLTFLYTLALYLTIRLWQRESLVTAFCLGLVAAWAAMVKGVALPYVVLFCAAYLVARWIKRGRGEILPGWRPVATIAVAMALVILPWTYRNYQVFGRFVLISSNASGEFLRGYVFAQPRYYLLEDDPYVVGENEANQMQIDLFKKQGLVWERDEVETEKVQNIAAKEKLRSDPGAFVKKFVIGFFMFWYVVTTAKNSLLLLALAIGGWVLAVIGMVKSRGEHRPFWLVVLPIAVLNLFYAAVLALGRYSAPCIPALMVLAAFGVDRLLGGPKAESPSEA